MTNLMKINKFLTSRSVDLLIYFLYITSIYGAYILNGAFVYDDWSVSLLGVYTDSVFSAYSRYFQHFTNRPLAPLFYALISRFGPNPSGYILVNCILWCSASFLISRVIACIYGNLSGAVFLYLAAIPLVSSTLIFSPGMQSLGSFALFLWALSFLILYRGMIKRSMLYVLISLALILTMVLSYEVCFPLLALSIVLPLMSEDFQWEVKRDRNIFLGNLIGIGAIVISALIYQKIFAPYFFGDIGNISRLRVNSLQGFSWILHLTNLLVTEELPKLLRKGLSITKHSPIRLELAIPFLLGCIGIFLAFIRPRYPLYFQAKNYFLGIISCLLGVAGVGVIHWGATVGPNLFGYANRGLGALAILIPFLVAILLSIGYNRNRVLNWLLLCVTFSLLATQLSCFMLVRSNFIEIARLQKVIMSDLDNSFNAFGDVSFPRVVLADIPEFLSADFNGENIYSDEVHDWSMSLDLFFPGKYAHNATLTTKKVCSTPKRAVIDGDKLILAGPDIVIPIKNIWFYRYDIDSKKSSLVLIKSPKEMKSLLETQFDCSKNNLS